MNEEKTIQSKSIITGMWACDLQHSKLLNDADKSNFNDIFNRISNWALAELSIEPLVDQFRGDGRFLVFSPFDVSEKMFQFADAFCKEINSERENGKISDAFSIRTYIGFGKVLIDYSNPAIPEAVGDYVNRFLSITDSKDTKRIEAKKEESAVLIATDTAYNYIEESQRNSNNWKDVQESDGVKLYVIEYRPKNLKISILSHNIEFRKCLANQLTDFLDNNKAVIVRRNESECSVVVISNNEERQKLSDALTNLFDSLKKDKSASKKCGIVLIDVAHNENPVDSNKALSFFSKLRQDEKNAGVSCILLWSDVALDELNYDENNAYAAKNTEYIKYTQSDKVRTYYRDMLTRPPRQNNKVMYFSDLGAKQIECVYLHSFDYGGLQLIKNTSELQSRDFLKHHLRQQLELALIMHDAVIVHSAEVLRSNVVYEIMKEYEPLISDGSIKLLFSSKVNNIRTDFRDYICAKIEEYSYSIYGTIEVESLQDALTDKAKIDNVIKLLNKCPQMLKRNGDGTSELEFYIGRDLETRPFQVFREKSELARSTDMLKRNYTLSQLLCTKYIDNNTSHFILQEELQREIISIIESLLNGVISASILIGVFEAKIPDSIKSSFKGWYNALLHRANYLYAKINTGQFLYMEYLPMQWRQASLNAATFYRDIHFAPLATDNLGCRLLRHIRNTDNLWKEFRLLYNNARIIQQQMLTSSLEDSSVYKKYIDKAQAIIDKILKDYEHYE